MDLRIVYTGGRNDALDEDLLRVLTSHGYTMTSDNYNLYEVRTMAYKKEGKEVT